MLPQTRSPSSPVISSSGYKQMPREEQKQGKHTEVNMAPLLFSQSLTVFCSGDFLILLSFFLVS